MRPMIDATMPKTTLMVLLADSERFSIGDIGIFVHTGRLRRPSGGDGLRSAIVRKILALRHFKLAYDGVPVGRDKHQDWV